ncbi:uncharacterized protein BO66DRAFT_416678 [Aspergillus aculeatinus CBS 121060]|uniref:Uncharacterized protein n=1 Tax=Aspergillus aculeatinus CBS 121060 TaxID=1448322 RepID=A0ACD1HPA8_9EURO|nr:hypothetical protein BO66DRAFT_416678 [Aspergillus aculeatinus CBS 121060]RAH75386.1 hypothetical protein BO66DRAFT_416678 [Aspergillus aculeatinus CBS 121060]
MEEPLRPNKADFNRGLRESYQQWSSYITPPPPNLPSLLPQECLNLKGLLQRTPSFLGCGLFPEDTQIPLSLLEIESREGQYTLVTSCRSIWRTSTNPEQCPLPPKAMPARLVVGVQSSLAVHLSDSAPLAAWPGTQDQPDQDEGSYLAVLFLAWAYILSARWAEIMARVSGSSIRRAPHDHYPAAIELGYNTDADETNWGRSILSGTSGRSPRTAEYNHRPYLSPWSVNLTKTSRIAITDHQPRVPKPTQPPPPSSHTTLEYLTRFSTHHRLHAQTSAALAAALYIPFLQGKGKAIPPSTPGQPLPLYPPPLPTPTQTQANENPNPIATHALLPYYMTLSTSPWGICSLLHSTFFNRDIECNVVSAWLNPAFAIIDPLLHASNLPALLRVLARRAPQLGGLWVGAFIVNVAGSILRDVRNGMAALDLDAAAWTGGDVSFLTARTEVSEGGIVRREDECRLLFLTSHEGEGEGVAWSRAPVHPWKPLGVTVLGEAEMQVRMHASCGCHCLEYRGWRWGLVDGGEIEDAGVGLVGDCRVESGGCDVLDQRQFELLDPEALGSEALSEVATRGIFGWLRSRGYPASERAIYQHEWVDLASSDDEHEQGQEVEDVASGASEGRIGSRGVIHEWLGDCV